MGEPRLDGVLVDGEAIFAVDVGESGVTIGVPEGVQLGVICGDVMRRFMDLVALIGT